MRILRDLRSFPPELRPSVAAFGAFDGIHLAHAKILDTAVERARALGVAAVACTFDPHPTAVLRPEKAPAPIATLEENLARIAEHGIDATLVIPFTAAFSRIEAEAFVDEALVRTLGAREVVVGFNHTFGSGARGTAVLLRELGARHGFVTHVLPLDVPIGVVVHFGYPLRHGSVGKVVVVMLQNAVISLGREVFVLALAGVPGRSFAK